jgi:hypothetical protein
MKTTFGCNGVLIGSSAGSLLLHGTRAADARLLVVIHTR